MTLILFPTVTILPIGSPTLIHSCSIKIAESIGIVAILKRN
jgi:hypothetical protein